MEDFNLVIKELINKNIEDISLPEHMRKEFEKTAERYIKNGNHLDAIKVFAITKNKDKLIETANICLKEEKPYEAFHGFYYAGDSENLNKIGFVLLQIPDIKTAFKAFEKAKNKEMIEFIMKNF
ncbi:hypothetical protein HYU23_03420 [Candidatus Woesearchaeota archaeon]|nr:hypothetical protein [Candidatus Woesearchaeota archaeon]